jgi:hypothetical protein
MGNYTNNPNIITIGKLKIHVPDLKQLQVSPDESGFSPLPTFKSGDRR